MKRRNVLDGKPRRPVKRQTKIGDNFYGSTLVYVKLLLLWALVLLADHFLEFRFEYLWPFWLFLRSVYDSFKYQGLAFSVFFVCIALTSDMICYLFIPVHWLFFAASTYVWVQYVWHTEKGICLPTVFLWLLFVYIEASIRLKEFKAQLDLRNLPFHMDLCRPFAAHCIGYPVVTLGFGFKTYVSYRMRRRRQREVQKVNEYYYEFLREALPPGPVREEAFNPHPTSPCIEDRISDSNGSAVISPEGGAVPHPGFNGSNALVTPLSAGSGHSGPGHSTSNGVVPLGSSSSGGVLANHHPSISLGNSSSGGGSLGSGGGAGGSSLSSSGSPGGSIGGSNGNVNSISSNHGSPVMGGWQKHLNNNDGGVTGHDHHRGAADIHVRNGVTNGDGADYMDKLDQHHHHHHHDSSHGSGGGHSEATKGKRGKGGVTSRDQRDASRGQKGGSGGSGGGSGPGAAGSSGSGGNGGADVTLAGTTSVTTRGGKTLTKEEQVVKLESDVKRLKIDLQISRNKENELRDQIVSYSSSERILKSEISNLQVEKSVLETKISNLVSTRAGEKATLSTLEKKLADERKQKADYQLKLESERKSKKEQANAERAAHQTKTHYEMSKLEAEIMGLKAELQVSEDRRRVAEAEAYDFKKQAREHGDPKTLSLNFEMLKSQKHEIEKKLDAEVKIKLDLFSALGNAKRQLRDQDDQILMKDKEIAEMNRHFSDALSIQGGLGSLIPNDSLTPGGGGKGSSLASTFNGVNGGGGGSSSGGGGAGNDSNVAPGFGFGGGSNVTPSTLSLDLPMATDLSSFNGQNRARGKGGEGVGVVGGGTGSGSAVSNGVGSGGRNNSGGAGGAGGLGLVNLEDQLTQMVTGSDLTSVTGSSSIFTTSAFRSNE